MQHFEIGDIRFRLEPVVYNDAEKLGAALTVSEQMRLLIPHLQARVEGEHEVTEDWLKDNITIPELEDVIHKLQYGRLHERFRRASEVIPEGKAGES